jgi:hypothetical protein
MNKEAYKKLNIKQIKEKYKTDNVYKWSFFRFSAPVYVIYKGQKVIIIDYRRHAYPEWITADALGVITKDRFHAVAGNKYIVGDARKSEIFGTFNRPEWPTMKMWKYHFSLDWTKQPQAQGFLMGNLTRWFDERARGLKKANRLRSVEDVMKDSIREIFKGGINWQAR